MDFLASQFTLSSSGKIRANLEAAIHPGPFILKAFRGGPGIQVPE
jgi:hypothetical protein